MVESIMCLDTVNMEKTENVKSRVLGSRRIFSPQFKIQVLDSYRQDIDCRGNQRATARKYNIHRRQIQKWLQCEQQLRASIADKINTDNKSNWNENEVPLNLEIPLRQTETQRQHVFHPKPTYNNITLKLVAQKLYPRLQGENVDKLLTLRDDNFNKINDESALQLPTQNYSQINVFKISNEKEDENKTSVGPESRSLATTNSEGPKLCTEVDCSRMDWSNNLRATPPTDTSLRPSLISPKRKWIQESLLENKEASEPKQMKINKVVLPAKQRVKLLRMQDEKECQNKKSPNFTIENICASKPNQSDISYPYPYPHITYPSPYLPPTFAPPIIYQHRVIPDLVSLHFKPSSPESSSSCDQTFKEEVDSDEEVDVTSTTPTEHKTFDFGKVTSGKRRSFSVQFKLQVLDAFRNDKDCNLNQRATARKFNINRRQVQKWLSQETELRNEGLVNNGKYLQRQRLGADTKDNLEPCKQCPQHCTKAECEPISIKQERDVSSFESYDNKHFIYNSDNSYDKCYFPRENLSVQFYPYNYPCDWPNFEYPCLVPYRPFTAQV